MGTEFEDHSARMAGESICSATPPCLMLNFGPLARVIQDELLKDLANKSEMSDWFNREETPKATIALVTRPHPKNLQNAVKIEELEQQIKRYTFNSCPRI